MSKKNIATEILKNVAGEFSFMGDYEKKQVAIQVTGQAVRRPNGIMTVEWKLDSISVDGTKYTEEQVVRAMRTYHHMKPYIDAYREESREIMREALE